VRKWTTSACVVLAWSIVMPLLAAADLAVPGHPAQATTTSITQITLAKAPGSPGSPNTNDHAILASKSATGTIATPEAGKPAATWTVRQGDSLSTIATAFGVPGGWQSLYAANRQAVGPDPDVIHPGTILTLPRRQAPMRYTVRPGDTLSGIAAALAIPGGWQELYAANRQAIGPDPNAIRPGTVLTAGAARAARAARTAHTSGGESPQPASRKRHEASSPAHAGSLKPSIQPTARASEPQRAPAANPAPAATRTMPNWLKDILIAAGLLAAIAFAIEPVAVFTRRRRHTGKTPKAPRSPANTQERHPARAPARVAAEKAAQKAAARARIIFADHERLIVTYSTQDDAVYVFTPPGEDPGAVLRAARLILPEDRYEELAGHLGLPSAVPLE